MKRTVSIPVDLPSERFLLLMAQCAEIFNAHVDWALANGTYNKNKAHRELYADLRQKYPSVLSALVQTVRDNAMEAVKATKFKRQPRKKPTSGLRYDQRTITLRGQQLTLSCIGKRVQGRICQASEPKDAVKSSTNGSQVGRSISLKPS